MDILPKSSISYNAERLSHPLRITFFPFWFHIKVLSFRSVSPYWQLTEGEYDFAEGFFLYIKHCSLCQSIFSDFCSNCVSLWFIVEQHSRWLWVAAPVCRDRQVATTGRPWKWKSGPPQVPLCKVVRHFESCLGWFCISEFSEFWGC